MPIIAIDPGSTHSAIVTCEGMQPVDFAYLENQEMIRRLPRTVGSHLAIEMIASYGLAVGADVFSTCVWLGRMIQAWGGPFTLVYRKDVKMHLCGSMKAKDANIRQALIDRYGPGKDKAIGKKASPGPLYGISGDLWAALAVGLTYQETMR